MKTLQRIWDWLFRLISYSFQENTNDKLNETALVSDYSERLESLRSAAQAVIADYYRSKMLLENEQANMEEAKRIEHAAGPDSVIAHNRFILSQKRVSILEIQVNMAAKEATRALEQLELLTNELELATLRLHNAQMAKRAADLRMTTENWRLEKELGLNKSLNALDRLEQESRKAQIQADLTSQTNDVLLGEPEQKNPEA